MKYDELTGQMNAVLRDLGVSADKAEVVVYIGSDPRHRQELPVSAVGIAHGDDEDGNEIILEVEDEIATLREDYDKLREQNRALRETIRVLSTKPEEVAS
jgi:hypothetical protein